MDSRREFPSSLPVHLNSRIIQVAYISSCPPSESHSRAQTCTKAWNQIHSPKTLSSDPDVEDEEIDPWDALNIHSAGVFDDTIHRELIPDRAAISIGDTLVPPIFTVQVSELPRSADVEWHALGLSVPNASLHIRHRTSPDIWTTSFAEQDTVVLAMAIREDGHGNGFEVWKSVLEEDRRDRMELVYATVYATERLDRVWVEGLGAMWVPCERVWSGEEEVKGVVVMRVEGKD